MGTTSTHRELPLVNAKNVFSYDKAFGTGKTSIELNCNIIYKANVLNYKGNLPGLTPITERPEDYPVTNIDDSSYNVYQNYENRYGGLTCNPSGITVHVGQNINFNAIGGDGNTYTWDQNDATPPTGQGAIWVTRWDEPSDTAGKNVTVQSGSQSAQCNVVIVP